MLNVHTENLWGKKRMIKFSLFNYKIYKEVWKAKNGPNLEDLHSKSYY